MKKNNDEKIKEKEIAIIAGASKAMDEFIFGEMPDEEKILSKVLKEIEVGKHLQSYVLAGANFALKKKIRKVKITEKEIMQSLSNEIPLMVLEIKENK